ncbi:hypothetical protein FKP32DRAFT_1586685 [Trametes sanguinea]|nr:hypothetical protein FKP32DRAFT_1586685 [Trametes sanguinea]
MTGSHNVTFSAVRSRRMLLSGFNVVLLTCMFGLCPHCQLTLDPSLYLHAVLGLMDSYTLRRHVADRVHEKAVRPVVKARMKPHCLQKYCVAGVDMDAHGRGPR